MKLIKIFLVLIALFIPNLSSAIITAAGNKSVPVSEISTNYAIQLYTGKILTWPDGQDVLVVILPRSASVSKDFIFDKLGISPYQFYESLDISIKVRKNNSIIRVDSEIEALRYISSHPGSIGYMNDYFLYNYHDVVKRISIE